MWQYDQADFQVFRTRLGEIDWDEFFLSNNIDAIGQIWTDTLISDFMPNKVVTVLPLDKPFYNCYLRRLCRAKDRAHTREKYSEAIEITILMKSKD